MECKSSLPYSQVPIPRLRSSVTFHNMLKFLQEDVNQVPNPKLEDHTMVAVSGCLFNILFAVTETTSPSVTRRHNMPWNNSGYLSYCQLQIWKIFFPLVHSVTLKVFCECFSMVCACKDMALKGSTQLKCFPTCHIWNASPLCDKLWQLRSSNVQKSLSTCHIRNVFFLYVRLLRTLVM